MQWLKISLLDNFTRDNLIGAAYPEIAFWKEPDGWTIEFKNCFIDRNFRLLKKKFLELNSPDCEYDISTEGLNPFIFDTERYSGFFNHCGEPLEWVYPVKNLIITHDDQSGFSQDQFDFVRTDSGYRLIGISITKGRIR